MQVAGGDERARACRAKENRGARRSAYRAALGHRTYPRAGDSLREGHQDLSRPADTRPSTRSTVDVEKGEFVFLVGASGSGKSTFLRLVLRENRPTSGRVYVAGKEINRLAGWKVPRLRRQIGTVFQDFRLLPNKTVTENVAFALAGDRQAAQPDQARSCPRRSSWSASRARATGCPTSCPAVSSSGSRSRARSSTGR